MKAYLIQRPVKVGKEVKKSGTLELDEKVAEPLVASGALLALEQHSAGEPDPEPEPKPKAKATKANTADAK